MAGAALLLSMNILQSPFASEFGLAVQLSNLNARSAYLPDEQNEADD